MADKTKIIFIRETVRQSWGRDFGSVVMFVSLVSLGWFAGSSALQWIGALLGLVFMAAKTKALIDGSKPEMTPAEAREWLDRFFPEASE